nr:chitinase-3-like protein 1 [Pogona vitticeps]
MSHVFVWMGLLALTLLHCGSAFKVVCYFTNWSQYRETTGRFTPENIDPSLCSHIIYAFAKIEDNVIANSEWNDATMYKKINSLKSRNPSLKTLLSVGGYGVGTAPFRRITRSPFYRSEFVISVVQFLQQHNFDGLDLSWHGAEQSDKERLSDLVKDLSAAFNNEGMQKFILSVSVPAGKEAIDKGYDIKTISEYVDFLNAMTYDFHGYWEDNSHPYTGHGSPLQKGHADSGSASAYNVDYAVHFLKTEGAPLQKIVMAIPTHGRTFTLSSAQTVVAAPASGPGTPGAFTKKAGTLAYYEICSFNHGATKRWIEEQSVPYSYKGNQWVGYEDTRSVQIKARYVKSNHLGGVNIWSLDQDDFSGSFCNEGKYPLLGAIKMELDKRE